MSVVNIYEVRRRAAADPLTSQSLGFFTDKTMAEQVIWACYRETWKTLMSSAYIPDGLWFTQDVRQAVSSQGFDRWSVDDYNSPAPLFYTTRQKLWNQVPPRMDNFFFTIDGPDF